MTWEGTPRGNDGSSVGMTWGKMPRARGRTSIPRTSTRRWQENASRAWAHEFSLRSAVSCRIVSIPVDGEFAGRFLLRAAIGKGNGTPLPRTGAGIPAFAGMTWVWE